MKKQKGFTLVELVIVIAVIAILSAVLLPTFAGILERARENSRIQKITLARDELFSGNFMSLEELNGYVFTLENQVYIIENGKIVNYTYDITYEDVVSNYEESTLQTSNNEIKIYLPLEDVPEVEVPKVETNFNFKLNEETKTALLIGYNAEIPEVLEIPEYVDSILNTEITYETYTYSTLGDLESRIFNGSLSSGIEYEILYGNRLENLQSLIIYEGNEDLFYETFYGNTTYRYYRLVVENNFFLLGEKNYKVTSIAACAFMNNTNIKEIKFSNTLEMIEFSAFEGCSNIETLTIPSNIKTICTYAFRDCTSLKEVILNEGIETMGEYVFLNCSLLTEIFLPNTIMNIYKNTFSGTQIEYNLLNNVYYIGNNDNPYLVAVSSATDSDIYDIHQNTITIAAYSFKNNKMTSIEFPSNLKSIGTYAFSACSNLKNVTLPSTLINLGMGAFSGCKSFTDFIFPEKLDIISSNVISGCTALTEINIPNNIIEIGSFAFENCTGIQKIFIPKNVQKIDRDCLKSCDNLIEVEVDKNNTIYDSRENCNAIIETKTNKLIAGCKKSVVPTTVTRIGINAFHGCYELEEIEIPNSVTYIESGAFSNCKKLTSIVIPNSVEIIENSAFGTCELLESVIISNSIEVIEEYLFAYCNNLIEITIPISVKYIDEAAFYSCSNLIQVSILGEVEMIGENAFGFCESLENVDIPNSVKTIGEYAFTNCTLLKSIEIPSIVEIINEGAFYGCSSLSEITFKHTSSDSLTIGEWAFYGGSDVSSISTTIIANLSGSNPIVSAIKNYAWSTSKRNVTYASL